MAFEGAIALFCRLRCANMQRHPHTHTHFPHSEPLPLLKIKMCPIGIEFAQCLLVARWFSPLFVSRFLYTASFDHHLSFRTVVDGILGQCLLEMVQTIIKWNLNSCLLSLSPSIFDCILLCSVRNQNKTMSVHESRVYLSLDCIGQCPIHVRC